MTFSFDPPRSLFYLVVFIVASSLLVIVVGRRSPARKAIGLVFALVIATMLVNRFYTIRGSSLTVDDSGITADVDGRATIPWASIEQAVYVDDVSASRYAPGRPTNMFATLGTFNARYGRYTLANGRRALVALDRMRSAGIVITTSDEVYVFGPKDVTALARAIADHVPLAGSSPAP